MIILGFLEPDRLSEISEGIESKEKPAPKLGDGTGLSGFQRDDVFHQAFRA